MDESRHYITIEPHKPVEIPAEALGDVGRLLSFLRDETRKVYRHSIKQLDEGKTKSNISIAFILEMHMIEACINTQFWLDKTGKTNEHTAEKLLNEVRANQYIDLPDIVEIISTNAKGAENYKYLRKTKANANKGFKNAREWLELPNSKELERLCDQLAKGWKLDRKRPPLYGVIVLHMLQAYVNYEIIENNKVELDEDLIKGYELMTIARKELEKAAEEVIKEDLENNEKTNKKLDYFMTFLACETAFIEASGIPAINFTAAKLSEALRPQKIKEGKGKKRNKGTNREPFIKRLEETIIYLIKIFDLPLWEDESIHPQNGHATKSWMIPTVGTMKIKQAAGGTDPQGTKARFIFDIPGEETHSYIQISDRLLNLYRIEEVLKNEACICAYYYIALKLAEMERAHKTETKINKKTLLKLCGYDGESVQTQHAFMLENVMIKIFCGIKRKDIEWDDKEDKDNIIITKTTI